MKTSKNPDNVTFDDLLFENRNQAYGAYALRRGYHASLRKAMVTAGSAFTLILWLITYTAFKPSPNAVPVPEMGDSLVLITIPLMPEPPITSPVENNTSQTNTPSVPQPVASSYASSQAGASGSVPTSGGDFNQFDPDGGNGGNPNGPHGNGDDRQFDDPTSDETEGSQPLRWATQMPEFIGGEKAMRNWVSTHFIIPNNLDDDQIKVQVMFVVDEHGKVDQISVKHGANPRINQEAVRVVSSMPAWKPGSMNGKPVKVWYCMPIVIKLVN